MTRLERLIIVLMTLILIAACGEDTRIRELNGDYDPNSSEQQDEQPEQDDAADSQPDEPDDEPEPVPGNSAEAE